MKKDLGGLPLLTWPDKKRGRKLAPAYKPPPVPEHAWHITLASTIRRTNLLAPGWRMTHFPAGEERDPRIGAKLKAMGLERGWPDLLFCKPANPDMPAVLHGLELKRLGGKLSDEQLELAVWFQANGWAWAVADRIEDAWRILWQWGALRLKIH